MKYFDLFVIASIVAVIFAKVYNKKTATRLLSLSALALAIRYLASIVECKAPLEATRFELSSLVGIAERVAAMIGTVTIIALSSRIIKHMSRFINNDTSDIREVLIDRLLGALDGLFRVVGFVCSFIKGVIITLKQINFAGKDLDEAWLCDGNEKMRFVANLN